MSNVTQLRDLSARDLKDGEIVRVSRLDCETFEVERFGRKYLVRNRTHFLGGQRVALSLDEVRTIIARA